MSTANEIVTEIIKCLDETNEVNKLMATDFLASELEKISAEMASIEGKVQASALKNSLMITDDIPDYSNKKFQEYYQHLTGITPHPEVLWMKQNLMAQIQENDFRCAVSNKVKILADIWSTSSTSKTNVCILCVF